MCRSRYYGVTGADDFNIPSRPTIYLCMIIYHTGLGDIFNY